MKKRCQRNVARLTNVKSLGKLQGVLNYIDFPPIKGYLTISEVAKILKKSRQATFSLMLWRRVKCIRVGNTALIHKSQISKLK